MPRSICLALLLTALLTSSFIISSAGAAPAASEPAVAPDPASSDDTGADASDGAGDDARDDAGDETSDDIPEDLPRRFRQWLDEVGMLLTTEERQYFLSLNENFRRDAFIKAFWAERDPFGDTAFNELKVNYQERSGEAKVRYETLEDARSRMYVEQGEPYDKCWHPQKEVEIWTYDEADPGAKIKSSDDLYPVLFFRPRWSDNYLRWLPNSAHLKESDKVAPPGFFDPAQRRRLPESGPRWWCEDGHITSTMAFIAKRLLESRVRDPRTLDTLELTEPSKEWVATFHAQTTLLPGGAELIPAQLDFAFPGSHQQRTVVQGLLQLAAADVGAVDTVGALAAAEGETESETEGEGEGEGEGETGSALADVGHHQFLVIGEIVRDDQLFDRFRYRFELPVDAQSPDIGMVFQRYLRPGSFRLLLKIEDLYGRKYARIDQAFDVPEIDPATNNELMERLRQDSPLFRALTEADAATARGEHKLQLLPPASVIVTGMLRLQTIAAGNFDRVEFLLDGQPILSKRAPPFSVELDMGELPSVHRVRVNGYAADDSVLATDEILLNPGGQRFRVALTEPQRGQRYAESLRAAVQVAVPDGEKLERVELFLNETRVATLFQPPFVQPVLIDGEQMAYVRAVGYLKDGNTAEDLVFINAPGEIDEIDIQFVELYAAVYDRSGRFIQGLNEADFEVSEDGDRQQASRFEQVDDLPLHVALVMDVSASMEDSIEQVAKAAQTFVEQVVQPKDRATLIAFNHQPNVRTRFTNNVPALSQELTALRTSGGTALYDSMAFALHYFHGIRGQRALLLLSDGEDEASSFDFAAVLEFARRSGVQIYAIGLKEAVTKKTARKTLKQLAEETGGRAFFVDDLAELSSIYAAIQAELRSQYLFAYQSTSSKDPSEFRSVQVTVKVNGKKVEVRTMSGYYP